MSPTADGALRRAAADSAHSLSTGPGPGEAQLLAKGSGASSILPAIAVGAALTLVVPALLWQFGTPQADSSATLLTLVMVLSGVMFSVIVGATVRRLHEMVFWLFVYLFLGVAPFIQTRSTFPGTTPDIAQVFAPRAALIVLVGCAAFCVGTYIAASRAPRTRRSSHAVDGRRTYAMVALALAAALVYVAQVGASSLLASRTDLKVARSESAAGDTTSVLIAAGAKMGLLVAFVALMQLRRQRAPGTRAAPTALAVVVCAALFACVNPIGSARYTFGTVFLAVLAALGAYATLNRFRIVAVSSLAGLVFVFPILDTFRRTLDATVQAESPVDSMQTGDFDAFAQIVNTYQYTVQVGITWGRQLLGVFLFWIPRDIWPNKPIDSGSFIAEYRGYGFTNISEPLWAELFLNFGWIGLVGGMVALGVLLRRLDQRAELALRISRIPDVLGCITPFYLLIVLRGSLLQATANLAVILLGAWFVSSRSSTTSSTPPLRGA